MPRKTESDSSRNIKQVSRKGSTGKKLKLSMPSELSWEAAMRAALQTGTMPKKSKNRKVPKA